MSAWFLDSELSTCYNCAAILIFLCYTALHVASCLTHIIKLNLHSYITSYAIIAQNFSNGFDKLL